METRNTKNKTDKQEVKLKIQKVSLAKMRKTVHKVMTKHYNDRFYQPIDLIKKILKKLKVQASRNENQRVRQQMNRWIITNATGKSNAVDSKKGIMQAESKKGILSEEINEKEGEKDSNNTEESTEKSTEKDHSQSIENQVSNSTSNVLENKKSEIPPVPPALCLKCSRNISNQSEIPIIDLENVTRKSNKKSVLLVDLTVENTEIEKKEMENEMADIYAVLNQQAEDTIALPGNLFPMQHPIAYQPVNWFNQPVYYSPYCQNYGGPNMQMYNHIPPFYYSPYFQNYGGPNIQMYNTQTENLNVNLE